MRTRLVAFMAVLFGIGGLSGVQAQQLVVNGDFETLALDEVEQPLLDVFGNAFPVDWYRSINDPPAVPYTELIGPENGDPATDSNGSGSYAAAINTSDPANWACTPIGGRRRLQRRLPRKCPGHLISRLPTTWIRTPAIHIIPLRVFAPNSDLTSRSTRKPATRDQLRR